MTEPLQLVARAGEEIVCPECGAVLAIFRKDAFGPGAWPMKEGPDFAGYFSLCGCGGVACKAMDHLRGVQPGSTVEVALAKGAVPTVFIRSGSWQGWRALGGE